MKLSNAKCLQGEISVPGDKSISHRAVMFGSIAKGTTEITGFLNSADCNSTIACFSQMGIDISKQKNAVLVNGKGLHGLTAPSSVLDAENSGSSHERNFICTIILFDHNRRQLNMQTSDEAYYGATFFNGSRYYQHKSERLCPTLN